MKNMKRTVVKSYSMVKSLESPRNAGSEQTGDGWAARVKHQMGHICKCSVARVPE